MATSATNKTGRLSSFCDDFRVEYVITSYVVITILGGIINVLVTVVVWKNKEMQNPTNVLLTSNAIAELIQIIVSTTMVVLFILLTRTTTFSPSEGKSILKIISSMKFFYMFPILISMITLAILAVERYNALMFPMKVHRRLSRRGAKIVMSLVWLISIILTLPFSEGGSSDRDYQIGVFYYLFGLSAFAVAISGFVIVFCYGRIIFAIFVSQTVCNQLNQASTAAARAQDVSNKKKVVKMLLSVTLIFVLTKFPPLSYSFLILFNTDLGHNCSILLTFFGHISALLNPIVYLICSSNYRNATGKLLQSCSCTKRSV